MCGVFGFISRQGCPPDIERLQWIAEATESRGSHAFGLAWIDAKGSIHTFKRPGPATANLGDLEACRDAVAVVGHCRWATHGNPQDNRNNHPHRAGRGWMVHNGVVMNYESLRRRYRLQLRTECDSEAICALMGKFSGCLAHRAARVAEVSEGNLVILGLWSNPCRLVAARADNPLYWGEDGLGRYFGSLPFYLPGSTSQFTNHTATSITYDSRQKRYYDTFSIERQERPRLLATRYYARMGS